MAGKMTIALYRPKEGQDKVLRDLIKQHLPILRSEGLATERLSLVLKSADGSYLEIFEWVSQEAVDGAHENPKVLAIWSPMGEAAEFATLASLPESGRPFPDFQIQSELCG